MADIGETIETIELEPITAPPVQVPVPPRPGRGDTTKTYPTSGDVIRKGKRR